MSITLATGNVILTVEDDGYITDATDWATIVEASHNPASAIACRITNDGESNYALEYYYKLAIPAGGSVPQPVAPQPGWGSSYDGPRPSYWAPVGPVWMFRKGQRVRFYDAGGQQVGPEQRNVAPAVAYAMAQLWASAT